MKHNVYFDGRVQSLALGTDDGAATVGVITPGAYTFSTDAAERVIVTTGTLRVKLPGQGWRTIRRGEAYDVPPRSSFDVAADADVSYVCCYQEPDRP